MTSMQRYRCCQVDLKVDPEHSSGDGCLSFDAIRFQSVRCGKFPIPMWLKAESTRMQFTRFPDRCTAGGTTDGVYLLHAEFLGFHSAFTSCSSGGSTGKKKTSRSVRVISLTENLLESALDFFRGEAVPHLTHTCPRRIGSRQWKKLSNIER
jgi:hypothetical protein